MKDLMSFVVVMKNQKIKTACKRIEEKRMKENDIAQVQETVFANASNPVTIKIKVIS